MGVVKKWIEKNKGKHLCQCGCGDYVVPTEFRYYQKKSLRFINLHQNRGKNHYKYKGGVVEAKGYIWHLIESHPRRTPRGYVKRCWLVAEKKIGRHLRKGEVVHHIDGNKLNDASDNLIVMERVAHLALHGFGGKLNDNIKTACE